MIPDEDADIRSHLAALGPAALADLRRILVAPSTDRTKILQALTARPASADLATLIAMADTDEVVRLGVAGSNPVVRSGQRGFGPRFRHRGVTVDVLAKPRRRRHRHRA